MEADAEIHSIAQAKLWETSWREYVSKWGQDHDKKPIETDEPC